MLPNQKISPVNLNLNILKKILTNFSRKGENPIRTHSRSLKISPILQGQTFLIYNGQKFKVTKITKATFGHKLGEFSPTRIPHNYKQKHTIKKKKK